MAKVMCIVQPELTKSGNSELVWGQNSNSYYFVSNQAWYIIFLPESS